MVCGFLYDDGVCSPFIAGTKKRANTATTAIAGNAAARCGPKVLSSQAHPPLPEDALMGTRRRTATADRRQQGTGEGDSGNHGRIRHRRVRWVRIDREFNWWIFDGFYRRGLTNPDIQRLIRLKDQGLGMVRRIGDSAQASDIKQIHDAGIAMTGVEKVPGTNRKNWDEWRAGLMDHQGRIQKHQTSPSSSSHRRSWTSTTIRSAGRSECPSTFS